VFAATQARFFWEISWQVEVEATGEIYRGDFATKMHFKFDATSMSFSLVASENLIDFQAPCNRCTQIAMRRWAQMQTIGDVAFWPLVVTGAPYYISDYEGRLVYAMGKVCEGSLTYECYQRVSNGIYTLRLGGGLFGRITGFPKPNASWHGCGESGTDRDQLVFRIDNGVCTPLQKHRYTWRCDRPPLLGSSYSGTHAPTASGTMAPTQNIYGETYVKGQMYAQTNQRHSVNMEDLESLSTFSEVNDLTSPFPTSNTIDLESKIKELHALESKRKQDEELVSMKERNVNGMKKPVGIETKSSGWQKEKQSKKFDLPHPILHFR
jgi:hypothetical protein